MNNEAYVKQVLKETADKLIANNNRQAILDFINVLIDNVDNEKITDYLFNKIVVERRNNNAKTKESSGGA